MNNSELNTLKKKIERLGCIVLDKNEIESTGKYIASLEEKIHRAIEFAKKNNINEKILDILEGEKNEGK